MKAIQQASENPPCLTFLFPQPTIDDIGLGKHLFHPDNTKYAQVHRIAWILGIRGLLLVANVFAAALVFFHPISLTAIHVPTGQVCLIVVFPIVYTVLFLTTFLVRKQHMAQETLPENHGHWYWGILAIAVHTSNVLSTTDLIAFLVFKVVPSLQETTVDVERYENVKWWAEVAVTRYIMAATAILETVSILIPQHYFFTVIATAWYAIWQFGMFVVHNKRLSSNASIIISLAGTAIVATLSLMTVFSHQQLASTFKTRKEVEFYTTKKIMDENKEFEDLAC